jgi:hypothetical protein
MGLRAGRKSSGSEGWGFLGPSVPLAGISDGLAG